MLLSVARRQVPSAQFFAHKIINFENVTHIDTKTGLKFDSDKKNSLEIEIKYTRQSLAEEPSAPNIAKY